MEPRLAFACLELLALAIAKVGTCPRWYLASLASTFAKAQKWERETFFRPGYMHGRIAPVAQASRLQYRPVAQASRLQCRPVAQASRLQCRRVDVEIGMKNAGGTPALQGPRERESAVFFEYGRETNRGC